MSEILDIERIAREVVTANTAPDSVQSVTASSSSGWTGEDTLRISIVVAPKAAAELQGEAPLKILVQLQDRLQQAGDDRFPIIDYATTDEINSPAE